MYRRAMMALIFIVVLVPDLARATTACDKHDWLIDQRTEDQTATDEEKQRLRCVTFVLAVSQQRNGHGWVEWHHVRADRPTQTHRLGLFPAATGGAMMFGRIGRDIKPASSALRVTVLLPTHRWWLVNTTRHGWQLRSGMVSEPDMKTLRKLFTDVALNAGVADTLKQAGDWWPAIR